MRQLAFPMLLMLLCYINLQYMHYTVLMDKYSLTTFSYVENIFHTLADVCLFFFLPLFLIKKKTYLFFIPYALITLLTIVNVLYSRFFYTYMPPVLYGEVNNLGGISASVLSMFRWSDITIVITTVAGILFYKAYHVGYYGIADKVRRIVSACILGTAVLIIGVLVSIATIHWSSLKYKYIHPFKNSPTECIFKFGILYGTAMQFISNNKQDYDPKEGASFSSFAGLCVSRQMYTAIKASQRKKHLPLNSYVSIYASASDNPEENGLSIVDTIEAGKESNPELMILGEEYTNAFEEELKEKLSKLERKVLYLHLQGMEYLNIAEFMDKSPKTIDNALQRIKAKARQLLEEMRRSEKK